MFNLFDDSVIQKRSRDLDLPWVDLVLLAEADKEDFNSVRFITLKSYYKDVALQNAINDLSCDGSKEEQFFKCLEEKANELIDSGTVSVKEFVEIDQDLNVIMCLNVEHITDDVIDDALNLLADINIEPNMVIEFGDDVSFKLNELSILGD